ncbi:MAG: DUF1127 domain-containing protein [Hyphomicrobiales bacterium]
MSCSSTICISTETVIPASNSALVHQGAERLVGWFEAASEIFQRRRQRQALLELEDHLLDDLGLSRHQAEQEARKPFWK